MIARSGVIAVTALAAGFAFAQSASVIDVTETTLEQRVEILERMLKARNESLVRLQNQVNSLQDELNSVRGENETHGYKLSQLLERQRELYQEIDKRMQAQQQIVDDASTLLSSENTATPTETYQTNLDEDTAYDRAVNLILKDKRYDQAIPEFRGFIESYPQSDYVANAHYWLGQLLFNKANYQEAKTEFEQVVTKFVDSSKRPDSLSKLATIAQKAGDNAKALQLYQQVVTEYPDSSSARLAEPKIRALSSPQSE